MCELGCGRDKPGHRSAVGHGQAAAFRQRCGRGRIEGNAGEEVSPHGPGAFRAASADPASSPRYHPNRFYGLVLSPLGDFIVLEAQGTFQKAVLDDLGVKGLLTPAYGLTKL